MTREEAIRILDEVIPPPENRMVDLAHLRIAQAWLCIKETLTAEPIKHGHWIWRGGNLYECSECGAIVVTQDYIPIELHKFCRGCGAKMDKASDCEACQNRKTCKDAPIPSRYDCLGYKSDEVKE